MFAIVGDKEVDATERLQDILGLTMRPAELTMSDMAKTLFELRKSRQTPETL
jgi:hypothetical protein